MTKKDIEQLYYAGIIDDLLQGYKVKEVADDYAVFFYYDIELSEFVIHFPGDFFGRSKTLQGVVIQILEYLRDFYPTDKKPFKDEN